MGGWVEGLEVSKGGKGSGGEKRAEGRVLVRGGWRRS